MAMMYQIRPSEMMGIENDYEAFCFDEVAFALFNNALDDKGALNWNKINWADSKRSKTNQENPLSNKVTSNKEFVDFARQFS